ncbi:MAG TPA: prepilin-type N-terminal cleavage/methylation domain-containing protein [Chthoniobacterales bacterium]|jgi:prepilin-type N-terminal cleavage/methylation domain-containing protein|nr:prepilin-type N-terminal cleavage/methylation domain-containing protein [Chthoniobacterales bacterium]
MLPPSRPFRPQRHVRTAGFTLIEIVIALAVLGVMSTGCYIGFNAINTYAVSSRLYSEAQTAAQNQIDLALSREPFDITAAYISGSFNPALKKIPVELMTTAELDGLVTSGVTFPSVAPTATPATTSSYYPYYPYYRSASGQPVSKQAFIYQDPVSGKVIVTGTLVTTVTDTATTMTFVGANTNLNLRRVTATVRYSFRNKDYVVAMDTLRTADQ